MPTTTTHAPGTFCWLDLAAHEPAAAKRFYTQLFGWEATDNQYGPGAGDVYTMYRLGGKHTAASYGMDPNQKEMGIPSAWLCYVAVENADAAARKARELGGAVMAEPFDVMDVGRMALVEDPTGVLFALWQAATHAGVGVRDEPGSVGWMELATNDTGKAGDFYMRLFGWTGETMSAGMDYTIFHAEGTMVGGMYAIKPDMEGMRPSWTPYFVVAELDASAERVKELGGTVLLGPQEVPGGGHTALIQDPQGAMFYLITWTAAQQQS